MSVTTFAMELKTKKQCMVLNRLHSRISILCTIISFPTNSVFYGIAIKEPCLDRESYWIKALSNFKRAKDSVCLKSHVNEKRRNMLSSLLILS